jgi:hypothetical protein
MAARCHRLQVAWLAAIILLQLLLGLCAAAGTASQPHQPVSHNSPTQLDSSSSDLFNHVDLADCDHQNRAELFHRHLGTRQLTQGNVNRKSDVPTCVAWAKVMPLNETIMLNTTLLLNHLHNHRAKKLEGEKQRGGGMSSAEQVTTHLQPTYLAMCVLVRDEPALLLEWLMYHHAALVRARCLNFEAN